MSQQHSWTNYNDLSRPHFQCRIAREPHSKRIQGWFLFGLVNFTLLHDCIPNASWSMKCFNILCDPMRLTFRNLWGYIFGCLSNLVCFRCLLKDIRVDLRISSYKGNDWFWTLYMNICYRFWVLSADISQSGKLLREKAGYFCGMTNHSHLPSFHVWPIWFIEPGLVFSHKCWPWCIWIYWMWFLYCLHSFQTSFLWWIMFDGFWSNHFLNYIYI